MPFTVSSIDDSLVAALQHKIDRKTKPLGALGLLEKLALQVGRIQKTLSPELGEAQMLVFAADHGAAKAGVSPFPQDVTWQMVENYLAGGAAINVFARQNKIRLHVIDAGVAHDFGERDTLINAKISPTGTRNYLDEPAMSAAERDAALQKGREIAHRVADSGARVFAFGEMGIGNTAAAALITSQLTGTPLIDCIGRGAGLDDRGLEHKRALLQRAATRAALPADAAALDVLAEFGGFEIAMIAGAMIGAAQRGGLLLIDGFIVTAALLVAERIAPAVRDYCVFCHHSAEPGARAQLKALAAEPLIDLGLRLGEGTGAALAWPLVQSAAAFLNEMASFESAGISEKEARG
ncbi:nicotinate-nucleotide--dimethylbenzimidazole phosphoribosyltransferase [Rhodocyclus tenuis]|uniref:Nicotinate-nucleotide--dimethylbenzimidazole phosphoribosyltransferase n=2 Tax=Rhodocyclus TaxID=1064 RepID=A0A6L5JZ15_RHOTE|nr:nicotinate-nucleotide--dimethylbenzimidazole phosphoribosyltransferase [Rhodocyclus gracilis]MQY52553.1 nicotinate-nucleotide--dimethylbenzimidazole phosphoribosyltransferase [Rhodocyclus gracilis]MRD73998.1 nicotinate-nucleotide--dimethylbenzimidazole phosphoribosyltransferase [Rhodocyclus gracilis]NJA89994.1 nicotinate-nucleotide--dimethylbenzimidazole phosphoribosyltransferase [Rhodocyclus gracilis]